MAYDIAMKIIVKKHDGKQEEIEIDKQCENRHGRKIVTRFLV